MLLARIVYHFTALFARFYMSNVSF